MSKYRAIAIGTFDGVHLGHQRLLAALVVGARQNKLEPLVAFFPYSPALFFKGQQAVVKLLTTVEERAAIIHELFGINAFVELPMKRQFFNTSAAMFLELITESWRGRLLVVGKSFGLGKDRALNEGSVRDLARPLGLGVRIV